LSLLPTGFHQNNNNNYYYYFVLDCFSRAVGPGKNTPQPTAVFMWSGYSGNGTHYKLQTYGPRIWHGPDRDWTFCHSIIARESNLFPWWSMAIAKEIISIRILLRSLPTFSLKSERKMFSNLWKFTQILFRTKFIYFRKLISYIINIPLPLIKQRLIALRYRLFFILQIWA
jgi:hypothetical protein